MKTIDRLLNPPAIYGPAQAGSVSSLTSKIKALVGDIGRRSKILREDRVQAGKLLIALREKFAVKGRNGKFLRGAKGSTFNAHLLANGIPIATAYGYIACAEGKSYGVSPNRIKFWLKLNTQMKKSTQAEKVALLKKAVAHMVKLYGVRAVVAVTAEAGE